MKIVGLSGILPSRCVSNQDVINLVEEHSRNTFQEDLPKTLKTIGKLLEKAAATPAIGWRLTRRRCN